MSPTPPQAGDRPWWARAAFVLVIVPGVLAALALVWLHTVNRLAAESRQGLLSFGVPSFKIFPRRKRASGGQRLIDVGKFGLELTKQLRGLRNNEHTILRVRSTAGTTLCRMACPVAATQVSIGDRVRLRGRRHRDGTLRVFEMCNQTTQSTHRPSFLGTRLVVYALVSATLVAMLLSSIGQTHAS